jgi:hypothetical protein
VVPESLCFWELLETIKKEGKFRVKSVVMKVNVNNIYLNANKELMTRMIAMGSVGFC